MARPGIPPTGGLEDAVRQVLQPIADLVNRITGVATSLKKLTPLNGDLSSDEAWRTVGATGEPVFAAAWVGGTSSVVSPQFCKDENGIVRLRGNYTKAVAAPSLIFTLPQGYWPPSDSIFPVDRGGVYGAITVDTVGGVTITTGAAGLISFEPVCFMCVDGAPNLIRKAVNATRSKLNALLDRIQED